MYETGAAGLNVAGVVRDDKVESFWTRGTVLFPSLQRRVTALGRRSCEGWRGQGRVSAGLHGDLCGFFVPDLTDEENIGVGAEDRFQYCRERQSCFHVDLYTSSPGDTKFYWVFHCDDVDFWSFHFSECCVQGGGFTNHQSVTRIMPYGGCIIVAYTSRFRLLIPTSLRFVGVDSLSRIRRTSFSPYTVGRVTTREVDAPAADFQRHTSVPLGTRFLGNVHVRHNFYAGHDRCEDCSRG